MKLTQAQLAHIKTLEDRNGRITAPKLVADARHARSPLHTLFNWNVKQAAEQSWLQRARIIIGAVTIQVTHNHTTIKAPCYIVDAGAKGGGYRSVVALQGDTVSARESLVYTLETAAGHLRRAYDLAVPLGLSGEIDALLAQIAGVKKLVEKKKAA